MTTVLSGIRSTGRLHLGNYFGAVKNFVKLQDEHECYFFIADYHSLTTHPKPEQLHQSVKQVLVEYLAAGLDPEKVTLYVQSDVPEIAELYLLLNMNAYLGELERTTSFKDKARKQPNNINSGLLTYPVLMAADILIHQATHVPVGKDQEQNLEMAKKFAKRFNHMYKADFFNIPRPFNFGSDLIKIPGLDGSGKMGKSEGNGLYLADTEKQLRKKVMKAKTDAGPTEKNSPVTEPVQNLFDIMKIVSDEAVLAQFKTAYADCNIRYGDLKKQLADDINQEIAPLRERIEAIETDNDYLKKVANLGAEKARKSARKTLKDVREIIGFKPF
ncbi:MAG: tryptophan--tRNA ligase [Bacteroidota bacterium]|nr:tryptophan--tRNA ligase [Bacteroidota bacterium]